MIMVIRYGNHDQSSDEELTLLFSPPAQLVTPGRKLSQLSRGLVPCMQAASIWVSPILP